ncbi:hypothetical protein [Tabrizicola sp.]|uniref:hypothetical protein n=1 Tax=Tabrizicola sp. TaxID=2005166 RepID=UPI003F31A2C7
MADDWSTLSPPIHRNEVFPALQAILRLYQQHDHRVTVQIAGVERGELAHNVARALAEFAQGLDKSGVCLLICDNEGAADDDDEDDDEEPEVIPPPPPRRRGAKGQTEVVPAPAPPPPARLGNAAILDGGLPDLEGDPNAGLVILDTPPILTSLTSSAIAGRADGVILVVSAADKLHDISKAVDAIRASGGRLLGVILTGRRYRLPRWLARLFGLPRSRIRSWTRNSPQFSATEAG